MTFGLQTAALNALAGRFDVSPAWKFYVEVLGVIIAEFQECSGLGAEREVKRVREGGTNDFEWLLPGQITYTNIILKRGITYNRELWRWFNWGLLDGQVWGVHSVPGAGTVINLLKMAGVIVPQGTHMSIVLGTVDGKKARHWNIIGAIPVRWSGPEMTAGSDQVAVESLEIAYQGIDLSLEMGTPMSFFSSSDSQDLSSSGTETSGPPAGYYDIARTGATEADEELTGGYGAIARVTGTEADEEITNTYWDIPADYKAEEEEKEEAGDEAAGDGAGAAGAGAA
jgi:phage tail-like protein